MTVSHNHANYGKLNCLLHCRPPSALPTTSANNSLPGCFSSFFTVKVSKLHSSLGSNANQHWSPHIDPHLYHKMTLKSPDKQCDLDPIPTSLLKECANILAPVITTIVNLSLDTGTFPSLFKQAVVTPYLEQPTLDEESPSNYWPISNLSFLSKLTERIVKDRITHHLSTNYMFNSTQNTILLKLLL